MHHVHIVLQFVGNHHGRAGGGEEVEQEGDKEREQCGREEAEDEEQQRGQREIKEQRERTREGKEQREEKAEESFSFGQNVFAQTQIELTWTFRIFSAMHSQSTSILLSPRLQGE